MEKHHGAFMLVGSEVSRMHQELNAVKGALEQVVHTLEYWDQPQRVQSHDASGLAAQANPNQPNVADGSQLTDATQGSSTLGP